LKKLESPLNLPKDDLCLVWLKLALYGSGEEVENVKVNRQKEGRRITGDKKSSLELKKKSKTLLGRILRIYV
jgi:hypothetical protein